MCRASVVLLTRFARRTSWRVLHSCPVGITSTANRTSVSVQRPSTRDSLTGVSQFPGAPEGATAFLRGESVVVTPTTTVCIK